MNNDCNCDNFSGAFENEDDATEFVKCKIESLRANEVKFVEQGNFFGV